MEMRKKWIWRKNKIEALLWSSEWPLDW